MGSEFLSACRETEDAGCTGDCFALMSLPADSVGIASRVAFGDDSWRSPIAVVAMGLVAAVRCEKSIATVSLLSASWRWGGGGGGGVGGGVWGGVGGVGGGGRGGAGGWGGGRCAGV